MTITNPMSTDSWNQLKKAAGYSETGSDETILADDLQLAKELTASLTADDSNFFAKGMLNAENPVVVKKVAHNAGYEVFLYYNFSSKAKLADYVAELLNSSSAYAANEDYITEKMLLTNNLGKIVNGISITKNTGHSFAYLVQPHILYVIIIFFPFIFENEAGGVVCFICYFLNLLFGSGESEYFVSHQAIIHSFFGVVY